MRSCIGLLSYFGTTTLCVAQVMATAEADSVALSSLQLGELCHVGMLVTGWEGGRMLSADVDLSERLICCSCTL